MKKFFVLYSFVRMNMGELIEEGRSIFKKMTGNVFFPTPDVSLAALATAIDSLEDSYTISRDGGGKLAVAKTNTLRKVLENLLRKLASYVDRIADGDEKIILSSGFDTTKEPQPATHPVFKVTAGGVQGQVILVHKAVHGATAYVWQYSKDTIPAEDKLWVFAGVSSQAKCVIENLDSLSKYWFRVSPVLRIGMMPWSDPLMDTIK
jgi:hypothetical protein